MNDGDRRTGLMLAMMEPHASMEEEFQDWYDSEHFPERATTNGFQTATRAVCIDGWPRYIAIYDLTHVDVLDGPEYGRIARENYSKWTHRIISRVSGHYRAVGRQAYPGTALMGAKGAASRIVLWRFRGCAPDEAEMVVSGLQAIYEGRPETAQVRVFAVQDEGTNDLVGLIELFAPWVPPPGAISAFGSALRCLDLVNTYVHYDASQPIPGGD